MNIEKQEPSKFIVTWEDFPGEVLEVDFSPFIREFGLHSGCLLHWQARPRSTEFYQGRCWGLYDVQKDIYVSDVAAHIPRFRSGWTRLLDIPEYEVSSTPTAVVYYPQLQIKKQVNELILLG